MADVNNKLRLQIVTQLDAAGIKATKDQIDQLELGIRRSGNESLNAGEKFGSLEKALGKLPGPIGKIGGTLGGLAGKATMVAGAFMTGVEIGNKICDDILKPLGLMPNAVDEVIKANKEYERQLEQVKNQLDIVYEAEMKRFALLDEGTSKAIRKIDEETAAYFRQATALEGVKKATGDAEMMQLERDKFEDMRAYSQAGYTEAAEQIGKYYDVCIAELAAKKQIEEFDRKSVSLVKEQTSAEQSLQKASERAVEAKAAQAKAEKDLADFREKHSLGGMFFDAEDAAKDEHLEKLAKEAKKRAERAEEVEKRRVEKLETVDAKMLSRQMERANLAAAGTLSVDRAAAAYDDYTAQAGNPLNAQIDPAWANELLQNTLDADQTQREMLQVMKEFGSKLEQLLEMK